MTRVYLADAKTDERNALRLVLKDLNMNVVGEAADWATTLAQVPVSHPEMLLIDWDLLSNPPNAALDELRKACPAELVIILISHLDAHRQAALSAGADAFISKGESSERVAERLRAVDRYLAPVQIGHRSRESASKTGTFASLDNHPNDRKEKSMNKDIFEGKWKQIRGQAKTWWGKLTDDDLDRVAGSFEILTGLLQEKYGYTREVAIAELNKRISEFEASVKK